MPDPQIAPVYALVGKDRFLREENLSTLLRTISSVLDGAGTVRFEGAQADVASVLDEVRTYALLGGQRAVVVDGADPWITAYRAAVERYCTSPSSTGCLFLLCNSLPRNTRLFKLIQEHGRIIECEVPRGRALRGWVAQRARATYGKALGERAAARLIELVGDAPGLLDGELAKLATYAGSRPEILPGDVDLLTGHRREETVFAVSDAIASGDAATALREWQQVLATDRAAPGRAIAGLAWALRRLIEGKRDFDRGTSAEELARRFFADPSVLRHRLERVALAELEDQIVDLLATDVSIKIGISDVESAVEKFIVRHAAKRARRATA